MNKKTTTEELKLHEINVSENFLKNITKLTKTSIKVYISLCYMKYKRGNNFTASHREICLNVFSDNDESWNAEYFGIVTCYSSYLRAFHQLEEIHLIKRFRSKTKNGKPLPNRYEVY